MESISMSSSTFLLLYLIFFIEQFTRLIQNIFELKFFNFSGILQKKGASSGENFEAQFLTHAYF